MTLPATASTGLLLKCQRDHPRRPPSWRWDRAGLLLQTGKRTPGLSKDDTWVHQAYRLRRSLDACKSEAQVYYALDRAGDLGWAYYLWDDEPAPGQRGPAPPGNDRHELEARLLSGEALEKIGARVGMSLGAITAYEQVFFNVLDRLELASWIIHTVIGERLHQGMTDRDLPLLWKLWAWAWRSPELLDQVITTVKTAMISPVADAQARITEFGDWRMAFKSAVAATAVPVNTATSARLLEIQAAMIGARATGDGAVVGTTYESNLQAALGGVCWLAGVIPARTPNSLHGEPRARELLGVAAGQSALIIDDNFPGFPEQPSKPVTP